MVLQTQWLVHCAVNFLGSTSGGREEPGVPVPLSMAAFLTVAAFAFDTELPPITAGACTPPQAASPCIHKCDTGTPHMLLVCW